MTLVIFIGDIFRRSGFSLKAIARKNLLRMTMGQSLGGYQSGPKNLKILITVDP